MAKNKIPLRNIQITFRRTSPMLKILVICSIVLCTIALITMRLSQGSLENDTAKMEQEAAQLLIDNEKLEDKIADVGSVQSVQQIAQEELDMVFPDTEFFEPEKDQ